MDIILSTVNARYMHTAFGLRYLYANMGELKTNTQIVEFVLGKNPTDLVEELLEHNPKIVGFGVYIWNNDVTLQACKILKQINPSIQIILGGPEISYETQTQELYQYCDYVICGEADFAFRDLCRQILQGTPPLEKIQKQNLPKIEEIQLPYAEFTDQDIAHRVIYVEASRGCPYKCEYCLSSLDVSVRNIPLEPFLAEMQKLINRGARQFKFVDRTFNLSPKISTSILQFFLERMQLGLFLHFELVPDRLPDELKALIKQFPKGSLQFEIGIQTWNPEVAKNVSRRQNYDKIRENFQFLREETGVHTHADLIVGLPGESLESFAAGFNALVECGPDEVQVGILKRLKGAPLVRHEKNFSMIYGQQSPFQLLQNKDLNFSQMQAFHRFSKFWDQVANSGNFAEFTQRLSERGRAQGNVFAEFWALSEFLFAQFGQSHSISRQRLADALILYTQKLGENWEVVAKAGLPSPALQTKEAKPSQSLPKRQAIHQAQSMMDI